MPAKPSFNHLLAVLARGDRLPWGEQLERVELPACRELHSQGASASHIHFPISALVVLTQTTAAGDEAPVAMVGNDGVVGVAAFLGTGPENSRAVVLHPGLAWRLPAGAVSKNGPDPVQVVKAAVGHLLSLTWQISQTAYCQQHHNLEQRLSRWLLAALDRSPGSEMAFNLPALAPLLGATPDELATAAERLISQGALELSPGRVLMPSRTLLQTLSCGCHSPAQATPRGALSRQV